MPGAYRRYLVSVAAMTGALLAAAAIFGAAVDPYSITGLPVLDGFNRQKPRQTGQARIAKPIHAARGDFDLFVLGTSQVDEGFNPADRRLEGLRIYNLGLSEMRLREAAALVDFLSANTSVKSIVVSLDFLIYDNPVRSESYLPVPDDLGWAWIAQRLARTFLSLESLKDSWETIKWNLLSGGDVWQNDALGWFTVDSGPGAPTHGNQFQGVDENDFDGTDYYIARILSRAAQLRDRGFDHTYLARIVRIAMSRKFKVAFFIAPYHAIQHEALRVAGLVPLFDQWRAEVACIVAPGFPLWDFSGYNDITVDDGNWSDTVHYESRVGNAILDRMLALDLPEFREMEFGRIARPGDPVASVPDVRYAERAAQYNRRIAEIFKGKRKAKIGSDRLSMRLRCDGPGSVREKYGLPQRIQ